MADALPIDIPYDRAAEWLVQRKIVGSTYSKSLRTVHARLAAALAEPRPPIDEAAALVPIGAARESVTYFDCARLLAALRAAGMADKNFLGQYTDAHAARWGDVVRRYESGALYLADASSFMVQQVGYELPALKAEASRAEKELAELQRRQGEYTRLAAGSRERFVAACEKKQLGAGCEREDLGRRLRESRGQLRATYHGVAELLQSETMVDTARVYREFVKHLLTEAKKFGEAEPPAAASDKASKDKDPKGKGGKGGKAKGGGGGGEGSAVAAAPTVAAAAVADPTEAAEASLEVLRQAQVSESLLGLYNILVWFEACVQQSILLIANTPSVWAPHSPPSSPTRLRNTVFPPDHPSLQYTPYNTGNGNIV